MTPTLIFVPGIGGSEPQHWQSLWQQQFGGVWVEQADWDAPQAAEWTQRLHETVLRTPGDLVLVAHSLGVLTTTLWARTFEVPQRVRGALLVAPPDPAAPTFPASVQGFEGALAGPLPFGALVVASENDPYASFARAEEFAQGWEAEFVTAGQEGHLNVSSGHGPWELGEILLSEVLHAWTPPDITRF